MKFIDLFAGIGGFRLGMESAGHECVAFCEIDKFARASYKEIHNTEGEVEWHDITTVSNQEFRKFRGQVDVICGGFPCQAFSNAGRRLGFEDTRGTLFFEIARATKEVQPQLLFLENVRGLLSSKTTLRFDDAIKLMSKEITEGTIWEEKFSPMSNWSTLNDNISCYLQEKLEIDSIFQKHKLGTYSKKNSKSVYEKLEQEVEVGLKKRLKYLATQILQTMKKSNCFQVEQTALLERNVDDWVTLQEKLSSNDIMKTAGMFSLEKMVGINVDVEKLLKRNLEENLKIVKSFTIATELKQTIDQKICMYVQEQNILLFIIKQWKLSKNFWKKVMSNLISRKENTYYVGTFNIILSTLDELGYDCEWQLLNSKDFGVPQNRERLFIIGHSRKGCSRRVFPLRREDTETTRPLLEEQEVNALGIYTNASIPFQRTPLKDTARTLKAYSHDAGVLLETVVPVLTPDRINKRQNGRRFKEPNDPMFTLTVQDKHGALIKDNKGYAIRKLTPRECWRLQGFPDSAFDKASQVVSRTQLYKQAGNSVTVNVISAISSRLDVL